MARDDYFVIVYQVLAYLYQRLKKGEPVDPKMLEYNSSILKCGNEKYWSYVIYNMHESGLIRGVPMAKLDGLDWGYPMALEKCMITPVGIEYLTENSNMKKAVAFLKDIREIVPFQL